MDKSLPRSRLIGKMSFFFWFSSLFCSCTEPGNANNRSVCLYRMRYTSDSVTADLMTKSNRVDFPPSAEQSPTKTTAAATNEQENVGENVPADVKPTKPTSLPKSMRLYQDEMLTSFVRRLAFSPDSALLVTPCGISSDRRIGTFTEKITSETLNHVAWLYLRGALEL